MKKRLFTPGPTTVPEETLQELAYPVGYHRSPEAKAILAEVSQLLKYVFQTEFPVVTLTSSGTGGMEAAAASLLHENEKVILLTAGRWGERFRQILQAYRAQLIVVEAQPGWAVEPEQLRQALRDHPDASAVFTTLSETSTGVGHDIEAFGQIISETETLLVVDGISGLGAMKCPCDDWHVDVMIAGSQKALMMPPGLAFVSLSEKAQRKLQATPCRNFYFDLRKALAKWVDRDTPFTPGNTLIRAQLKSLKRMHEEGIENIWLRHERMATATRQAIEAMGLTNFARRPNNALTVIQVPAGLDGSAVLKSLEQQFGYKLADGQESLKGTIWRLSHMGYTDAFEVLGALAALEIILKQYQQPIVLGQGLAAFQQSYASSLTQ